MLGVIVVDVGVGAELPGWSCSKGDSLTRNALYLVRYLSVH